MFNGKVSSKLLILLWKTAFKLSFRNSYASCFNWTPLTFSKEHSQEISASELAVAS